MLGRTKFDRTGPAMNTEGETLAKPLTNRPSRGESDRIAELQRYMVEAQIETKRGLDAIGLMFMILCGAMTGALVTYAIMTIALD